MADINDELSPNLFQRVPRLALLGSAAVIAVLSAGLVTNAMLNRSQLPHEPTPATAEIYMLPDAQAPGAAPEVRQAEPLPTAEGSPGVDAPATVASIPPKPLEKPVVRTTARTSGSSTVGRPGEANRACEADECVSWEATVARALAEPPAQRSGQGRIAPPRDDAAPRDMTTQQGRVSQDRVSPQDIAPPRDIGRPMARQDGSLDIAMPEDDQLGPMDREPSTVGGMARSAATTVVTQSEKLVDNMMRWSDSAVSKLTPPRWGASSDDRPGP